MWDMSCLFSIIYKKFLKPNFIVDYSTFYYIRTLCFVSKSSTARVMVWTLCGKRTMSLTGGRGMGSSERKRDRMKIHLHMKCKSWSCVQRLLLSRIHVVIKLMTITDCKFEECREICSGDIQNFGRVNERGLFVVYVLSHLFQRMKTLSSKFFLLTFETEDKLWQWERL